MLAILVAFAAGCSHHAKKASPKRTGLANGGTLVTLANTAPPGSPDPQINYSRQAWQLLILTHDGLVGFKRTSGNDGKELVPDLATAIPKPMNRGRTYVFKLRKGIKFSNGKDLKPSDVSFTFERLFKLRRSPNARAWYQMIVGGALCVARPRTCSLAGGVVADDSAGTVTFNLTRRDPEFLYKLAVPFAFVLPGNTPTEEAMIPPSGTGPYEFNAYDPGRQIKLTRNVHFKEWSKDAQPAGNPDTIVQRFGLTVDGEVTHVEADEADWVFDHVPADRLEAFRATRFANQVHVNSLPATSFFAFNVMAAPFNNVLARRAVNFATDRNALVQIYGGPTVADPTCQVLAPDLPGYEPYCPYTKRPGGGEWHAADLVKARRLVAASGTRGAAVKVATGTTDTEQELGLYFVRLLNRLGYRARLRVFPADLRRAQCKSARNTIQLCASSWVADYPAGSDFFTVPLGCGTVAPRSKTSPNVAEFCDRRIQARTDAALALEAMDPDRAARAWAAIDRAVTDQAPWATMFNPKQVDFVSSRVTGYAFSPQWGFLLGQASVQ